MQLNESRDKEVHSDDLRVHTLVRAKKSEAQVNRHRRAALAQQR
jgi:hypothetical protein